VKVTDSEIQNLEWRVVEAAVEWYRLCRYPLVLASVAAEKKLNASIKSLITARDQAERKDLADARNKTV